MVHRTSFQFSNKTFATTCVESRLDAKNLQVNDQHVCAVSLMLFLRCTFKGKLAKMNCHIRLRLTACIGTCWSKCVYIKCSGPWMMSFFKDKHVVVKISVRFHCQHNVTPPSGKKTTTLSTLQYFFKPTNSPSGFSLRLKLICFFSALKLWLFWCFYLPGAFCW